MVSKQKSTWVTSKCLLLVTSRPEVCPQGWHGQETHSSISMDDSSSHKLAHNIRTLINIRKFIANLEILYSRVVDDPQKQRIASPKLMLEMEHVGLERVKVEKRVIQSVPCV